ncbi:hypothetical protein WJX74_000875 [Apatococcus lobatus]|uniref:Uncharacterized protein n=1 Tax=Apatococcus lobatus TaxID=904363 RepID=A0AAW1RJ95_9CHLO
MQRILHVCCTLVVFLIACVTPLCWAVEPATCSNSEAGLPADSQHLQPAAGILDDSLELSEVSSRHQQHLDTATRRRSMFARTLARHQPSWTDLFAWQAVVRSEHAVTALHLVRKPLALDEQQSSGPMPWQSRGSSPDGELLAIGTAKGALHLFDWQGRLLLDLPQAIPGMALLAMKITLKVKSEVRPRASQPKALSASLDDVVAGGGVKMQDVKAVLSFRAGTQGQQLIALTSDSTLHVFSANGTRLLCLQTREPVLDARMGAPATVNIITPHALLALPLHPPRLIKTLHQLGLLLPPASAQIQIDLDQAAAASSPPDDSQQQMQSKAGLRLASEVGHGHPSACQGLQAGEMLLAAAWEESQQPGSKGTANKGPGILPRALGFTSSGDLVRLAMLPGPKGTSKCQVRSRSAAGSEDKAVPPLQLPASMLFLAGAYLATTPAALHLFNTSAFIVSPPQPALQHSLKDELAAFDIQDDKEARQAPAVLATGSAGQLAVALGPKTVGMYQSLWPSPVSSGGQQGRSGWDMWTRPLFIFVAIGVGVWQFSRRRSQGDAITGGLRQGRDPAALQALMQGLSDSPRKLAAFQQDLSTQSMHGRRRVHHSPHATGLFGNGGLSDGNSDSD